MSVTPLKTPWHLWLVGLLATAFNAIGVVDFVLYRIQGAAYQTSMGMTAEQVAHYQQLPGWVHLVWTTGVFSALAASLLLLLRKRLAAPVFALSLAAFLLSLFYTYVLAGAGAVMGLQMAATSAVIAVLLLLFVWYARAMAQRGLLR